MYTIYILKNTINNKFYNAVEYSTLTDKNTIISVNEFNLVWSKM